MTDWNISLSRNFDLKSENNDNPFKLTFFYLNFYYIEINKYFFNLKNL